MLFVSHIHIHCSRPRGFYTAACYNSTTLHHTQQRATTALHCTLQSSVLQQHYTALHSGTASQQNTYTAMTATDHIQPLQTLQCTMQHKQVHVQSMDTTQIRRYTRARQATTGTSDKTAAEQNTAEASVGDNIVPTRSHLPASNT